MTDSREGRAKAEISFAVNGEPKTVHAYPMERLLDVLRQQLQLTGTKEGCGEGECGSCAVLMDGILVNSCLVPVLQAAGSSVITIERLAAGGTLHVLQKAFPAISAAAPGTARLLTLWRKRRAAGHRHEIKSL